MLTYIYSYFNQPLNTYVTTALRIQGTETKGTYMAALILIKMRVVSDYKEEKS